jgi:hypothetical protein
MKQGLNENKTQFILLVLVNAFVAHWAQALLHNSLVYPLRLQLLQLLQQQQA